MLMIISKHKLWFTATVITSLMLSVVAVASAFVLQNILDAIIDGDWEKLQSMIWVVVLYCVVTGVVAYMCSICAKRLLVLCVKDMRQALYRGIFSRDTETFQSVNTADYISALTNDLKIIEEDGLTPFVEVFQYVFMFIMAAIALFYYNPIIAGLVFASLVVTYLVPASLGKPISRRQGLLSAGFSLFTVKLKDQLSGYDVIHSFQLADRARNDFAIQNKNLVRKKFSVDKFMVASESLSGVLGAGTQLFVMLVAGYLAMQGEITAGVLLAILQLSGIFVQPIGVIMQSVPSIMGTRPVRDRVLELSSQQPSLFEGKKAPAFDEAIRFEGVSFAYTPEQPVLNELSATLEKNGKYVIVGGSGSGKTTLVRLLCANYGGYTGGISFDGVELRELDIDKLLTHISFIHQNVYMFDESIRSNIDLHREYSRDEWEKALATSGVDRFLELMEDGLDTPVGENGVNLSGGQRQRVAVARALIQKKPLLILDEGTSAIDRQTAYDIESALLGMPDITLITITHNLTPELLRQYDGILFLEDGRVAESGSYDTLMEAQAGFVEFLSIREREDSSPTS